MFCSNCGNEVNTNSKFCNYCGAPLESTSEPQQNAYQESFQQTASSYHQANYATVEKKPEKKKRNKMMIVGVVLLCLQVIGTCNEIIENGSLSDVFSKGIPNTIGWFLIGGIGLVLLIVSILKEKQ